MKGIILAAGLGTRLRPLTHITNKPLLPVYDRPMIAYSIQTLQRAGIEDILIVCSQEHEQNFINFLGAGENYGVKISYATQCEAKGIAHALALGKDFAAGEKIAVILGDNIFEHDFMESVEKFKKTDEGAMVFVKEVSDASRFGVVEVDGERIVSIEEKPAQPKSNLAITGFYLCGPDIFDKIEKLKPSPRNEFEITDALSMYAKEGRLQFSVIEGFWSDAGTFDSLLHAANWAAGRLSLS